MSIDIIGLDVATDSGRTGIAVGRWEGGRCALRHVAGSCTSDELRTWVAGTERPTLLAVDAPLGWPVGLADALVGHRAGMAFGRPRKGMFCRATDRFVHRTLGKKPLDVGADRIAYTAHRALELMDEVGATLAWTPSEVRDIHAIEVYPGATLVAMGLARPGYKDNPALRLGILEGVTGLSVPEGLRAACVASSDALDAVLAVLAGVHFLEGRCRPVEGDAEVVRREGWIWVLDRGAGGSRG